MKRKMNLFLLICLIVSFMTTFNPANVYACSCAPPLTVKAELSRSEAVFTGRVLEVKDRNLNGYMTKSALFDISQIWKGGSASQIIIQTGGGGGDCGYHFEKGKDYLVYAKLSTMYGDKENLVTIICDRTNLAAQAQEDLAILGEGMVPIEQVNLEDEFKRILPSEGVTVLGIVAIGMMVFFIWRKMRK